MALTQSEQQELAQLESKYGKPKSAGLSPDEARELEALEEKYKTPEQGLLGKGLDYGLRGLDYLGGVGRYAAAGIANLPYAAATGKSITAPEDLGRVVRGQAPGTAEYMERAGVPDGARVNLSPLEGDTSVRDVVGFAGDVALDPLTYAGGAGLLRKGLRPVGGATEAVGKKMYRSGFKKIDERLVEQGKKKISDVLLESGAPTGTTKKLAKNMVKTGDDALRKRADLYKQATDLGVTVDLRFPLKNSEELIAKATSKKASPRLRKKADELMDMLLEYKREGKVDLETLSDWKTGLYDDLPPSAFGPDGKPKGIYSKFEKALANDFKQAIVDAGNKAQKGMGDEIDKLNETLGTVISSRKPTKMQVRRGETTNMATSVDAMLAALASPAALASKKGADVAKTTYARTKVGKGLINAGQSGLLDPVVRQGLVDKKKKDDKRN